MKTGLMVSEIDYLKESWSLIKNESLEMASTKVSSRQRVHWVCPVCHYEYTRSVLVQYQNQGRCPRCEQRLKNKDQSLSVRYPEIAKTLVVERNQGWTGEHVTPFSHRVLWWRCVVCQEVYEASVAQRVTSSHCPFCSGKKVSSKNSLAVLNSSAASEWDIDLNQGLTPHEVTANSNKEFWFRCKTCDHVWLARCNARTSSDTGCPECAKQRLRVMVRKRHLKPHSIHLGMTHPWLAQEWLSSKNPGIPLESIKSKSNRMVWWQCSHCQYEWPQKVIKRTQTKKGRCCPNCRVDPLVTDCESK